MHYVKNLFTKIVIIYLSLQSVCPYGDYYEPVESNYNDGDVEVFETFVDPFTLRDSSARDPSSGMDIVLNIRHDFNLDLEDISGMLPPVPAYVI